MAATVAAWASFACALPARAEPKLEPIAEYASFASPLLTQYCGDCHAGAAAESGLDVEALRGGDEFQRDRSAWLGVLRRLRAGDMPPHDAEQPTDEQRNGLIEWVEAKLDSVDCTQPADPGRVTLRRLNRDQYRRTVRDLLGVEYDPSQLFAPDELAGGFDNNAKALSLAPTVFEKHFTAAGQVARLAIPTVEQAESGGRRVRMSEGRHAEADGESRFLFAQGEVVAEFKAPRDARYAARVVASGDQAGDEPVRMQVRINDERRQVFNVLSDVGEEEPFVLGFDADEGDAIEIGAAFVNDYYKKSSGEDRNLLIEEIRVFDVDRLRENAPEIVQRELLAETPAPSAWDETDAWRSVVEQRLRDWLPKAYRRSVSDADVASLLGVIERSRAGGDSYLRALQTAVRAVLSSQRFLFIGGEVARAGEGVQAIDDYALASRLSYFLWGSTPDAELLRVAGQDALRERLAEQTTRLLRDPRRRSLAESFAGQWLETRRLLEAGADRRAFDAFDPELRDAMIAETERFFDAIVEEDLPITALLDADFTFVNRRLAEHYGIDGVESKAPSRIQWSPEQLAAGRGGLLGMASLLTVTSNPDRTSPVLRGRFVLASLLGEEPPPPPPNVPALVEGEVVTTGTVRERLERHRDDPACAACHAQIDPFGFALERFDGIGRERATEGGQPIDDSAVLADGSPIHGATGLRAYLLDNRAKFRETMARKLLTYALGRSLTYHDECAVREIVSATESGGDRFTAMAAAVVNCRPFLFENTDAPE